VTGTENLLFWLFAGLTCGGAVGVVISRNIVRMAFCLIVSLGSTAGLFFLLEADFVGATQLLVYVGGTLVLLIFGVMLTGSGPFSQLKMSPAETFLGATVGGLFLAVVAFTVITVDWDAVSSAAARGLSSHDKHRSTSVAADNPTEQQGDTARAIGLRLVGLPADHHIGNRKGQGGNTGYLLPFEIISVHLLVVLIGAAYLARAKRRVDTPVESMTGEDEE